MLLQATSRQLDESHLCTVRLDRIQFRARMFLLQLLLNAGFERTRDRFVRSQTSIVTYRRVAKYINRQTETKLDLQYDAACPWLWPFKASVFPDDRFGLSRRELQAIFDAFSRARLLTLELGLDFAADSGIDREFVLRHGVFGKSRPVGGRLFSDLRFGTRHSNTMARAYDKPHIGAYRVETELHSNWLRAHNIARVGDLSKLAVLISPGRINFVSIQWDKLRAYLLRQGLGGDRIIAEAQSRAGSLWRVLDYLRREAGIVNVHRLLQPLPINGTIRRALREWARQWAKTGLR